MTNKDDINKFNPDGYDSKYNYFHFYPKIETTFNDILNKDFSLPKELKAETNSVNNITTIKKDIISNVKSTILAEYVLIQIKNNLCKESRNCISVFEKIFEEHKKLSISERFTALNMILKELSDEPETPEKVLTYKELTKRETFDYKDKISAIDIILKELNKTIPKQLKKHIKNKKILLEKVYKSGFVIKFEKSKKKKRKNNLEKAPLKINSDVIKVANNESLKKLKTISKISNIEESKVNNIKNLLYENNIKTFSEKISNIKDFVDNYKQEEISDNKSTSIENLDNKTDFLSEDYVKSKINELEQKISDNRIAMKKTIETLKKSNISIYDKIQNVNKIIANDSSDKFTLTKSIVNSDEYFKFGAGIKVSTPNMEIAVPSGYYLHNCKNIDEFYICVVDKYKPLIINIISKKSDVNSLFEFFNSNIEECEKEKLTYRNTTVGNMPAVLKQKDNYYKLSAYNKKSNIITDIIFEFNKTFLNMESVVKRILYSVEFKE